MMGVDEYIADWDMFIYMLEHDAFNMEDPRLTDKLEDLKCAIESALDRSP